MKKTKDKAPSKKKKAILWGLGLLASGLVTFFGIQYWKKNQDETPTTENPSDSPAKSSTPKTAQPKKTTKASTKKVAPKASSTKPNPTPKAESKPINAPTLAKSIYNAVINRDYNKVLEQVTQIKSVIDYSSVSNEFRKFYLNGVRQTLVNGLLSSFSKPDQKQAFQKAFINMGLKFDGKKWSLSGIERLIITTSPTKVWKDPQHAVAVPINMVLGSEVDQRGEHTVFENEGQYFLVESKSVKYYQA